MIAICPRCERPFPGVTGTPTKGDYEGRELCPKCYIAEEDAFEDSYELPEGMEK